MAFNETFPQENIGLKRFVALSALAGVALLGVSGKVGSDVIANRCDMQQAGFAAFEAPGLPESLCDGNDSLRERFANITSINIIDSPTVDVDAAAR